MGWFQKLSAGLSKTRDAVTGQLDRLLGRAADPALLDELEVALISADLGLPVVERVMEQLRAQMRGGNFSSADKVRDLLRQSVLDILLPTQSASINQLVSQGPRPFVILAVGVNGVGKTTTIAKLTQRFCQEGKTSLLVAGDTFRAAAIDQLQVWADRIHVDVIRHRPGADPAAVAYDGMTAAKGRGADVVLIDTAGRLHTKANLMEELRKIKRVVGQECQGAPHEVLLVLDATVGQNGIAQAREFTNVAGVTGIVLTKLDGTAKGGVAVAIAHDLKLPIRYVGVGEGVDDLLPFNPREYVDAIFQTKW